MMKNPKLIPSISAPQNPNHSEVSPDDVLDDFALPEPVANGAEANAQTNGDASNTNGDSIAPSLLDQRKGERRRGGDRRDGLRGHWEERRMFDRRKRAYSIFGTSMDGEQEVPNPPSALEVPLEMLISPAEVRILEEEAQLEAQPKTPEEAPRKTPNLL